MFERLAEYEDDIEELKSRFKVWAISFFSATLFFLVFPANLDANLLSFYKPAISVLLDHIRTFLLPISVQLIPGTASAPISVYTYASAFFGFLVSSPVLFYEVYAFIRPALPSFPHRIVVVSFALFIIGCLFGFFILAPAVIWGLVAFFPYVGVTSNFIEVSQFYSMIFWTTIITGLCFLTPMIIFLATRYLNFDPKSVTKNRWYLWAGVYIGSAIVTPDSNILADFVLFLPLIAMIEVSLFLSSRNSTVAQSSKDRQC